MGLFSKVLGIEQRAWTLAELDAQMDLAVGSIATMTGLEVSPGTAMASAVVYACVNVLAQQIASLPLIVYRKLASGGKERAPNHPLYPLLHDAPNPEMTSYEFRCAMVGNQLLWGNAYAEIERSDSRVNGLWPLRPDRMIVQRNERNRIEYKYRLPDGRYKIFPFEDIMHWRGLSTNGVLGLSPIQQAAEAIGVDLATRQFAASFFGNDSRPGGVLKGPKAMSDKAYERLKSDWESKHRGLDQSHRVAILEEGYEWQAIGVPPEQAQFLETRKYQRSEIAAVYRVPLHLINDLERATFSNIEHQSLEFVKYSLMPWLVQIEQAIKRDLFRISAPQRSYFAEHLVDGLLRGDIQSRYQAYQIARQNGWMNADEIRELENMNPIPDGDGKVYWMPMNMMGMGEKAEEPATDETPVSDKQPETDEGPEREE